MTQPAQQPTPVAPHTITIPSNVSILRAVVSVCETAAYVVGAVLYLMNNGSDTRNAIASVLIGTIAHGVNHNAGGSPV